MGVVSKGFPGSASGKEPASVGDIRIMGSVPGLGRSPGGGQGNPIQYSCLKNPMDRGAWQATVCHGVAKSWTQLSLHAHIHTPPHTHKVVQQKDGKKLAL